ncbi:MAG: metallophosphoesterase [Campylobacterales bacterium]|nr:metallophosphoesterase [Campylobacterales bacterium]
MNSGGYWIIGDAHGCYYTVLELIEAIGTDDGLIFTGDLVDRGSHSRALVGMVKERGYGCVMGNHELMMLRHYGHADAPQWASSKAWGGGATIKSYAGFETEREAHLRWIKSLPYYLLHDRLFISHGFGLPYFERKETPRYRERLAWSRLEERDAKSDWEAFEAYDLFNVFGHTVYDTPLMSAQYAGIDTGCAYGRRLSALHYPSLKTLHVNAHRLDL